MSEHPSRFTGDSITDHIRDRIQSGIPGATAEVDGGGGHFTITVTATQFKGKTTLEKQRMVYATIQDLMQGMDAPIHAVDTMVTLVPEGA
jgi:acid stress-induced BolA-like protein IbaG/YrbA